MDKLGVAILVFDGVEVLDFAGPYEIFSRTRLTPGVESRRSDETAPFRVFTVAHASTPVMATGGLRLLPDFDFATAPPIDLLVVPGGFGTRSLLEHAPTLDWIRQTARRVRRVTSVCTGSLLLARAGLLAGRRATTHWAALDLLATLQSGTWYRRRAKWRNSLMPSSKSMRRGGSVETRRSNRSRRFPVGHMAIYRLR